MLTILYNIPKFMELRYNSETKEIYQTSMRQSPLYIALYIFWSKFIFVELIPYVTIIVLNSMIMAKIYKSTKFQKNFRYKSTIRSAARQESVGVSCSPFLSLKANSRSKQTQGIKGGCVDLDLPRHSIDSISNSME